MTNQINYHQACKIGAYVTSFIKAGLLEDRSEYQVEDLQRSYDMNVEEATHLYNAIQIQMKM